MHWLVAGGDSLRRGRRLISPEPVEPARVHPCVPLSVLHVGMSEVGRERQGIHTLIHELEAATMAQGMRMNIADAGPRRGFGEQFKETIAGHRRASARD